MARKVDIRAEIVILPSKRLDAAGREVDIRASRVFVEYPDDTTGAQLDEIIRATASLGGAQAEKEET